MTDDLVAALYAVTGGLVTVLVWAGLRAVWGGV